MFGMLGNGNLSQKGLRRPTPFQQMRRRSGLHDARSTLGACVFRADRDDDLVACRDPVEPFRPILADPHHVAATAGTNDALGLDHFLDPRQVFGQCTSLALLARSGFRWVIRGAGFDLFLDGGDLCLCFGNRRFKIFQRQLHLRRIQLFRLRPKLRAPIVVNLPFKLLDQFLQLGDERVLFSNDRLLMLTCSTLDRQLELRWRTWRRRLPKHRQRSPSSRKRSRPAGPMSGRTSLANSARRARCLSTCRGSSG